MSPWAALLESLHSAVIDELNERLPSLKPELGMPIRQKLFAFPAQELPSALLCEISFATARGFAMLGIDADCEKKLRLGTPALWAAVLLRARADFTRRGIAPQLSTHHTLLANVPSAALPAGYPAPSRIVWIPFRLHPGVCILGLGA